MDKNQLPNINIEFNITKFPYKQISGSTVVLQFCLDSVHFFLILLTIRPMINWYLKG
jgi:hypothetical protein